MTTREFLQLTFPLWTVTVFVLGACVGSFLNVVIWRLPRNESLATPPSHCPKCGTQIRAWENIPILSWILLRGRCAHCGLSISARYPMVEAATALLFLGAWLRVYFMGIPVPGLINIFYMMAALMAISLIDIDHYRIPNSITYPGIGLALLLATIWPATRMRPFPMPFAPAVTSEFPAHLYNWLPELIAAYPRQIAILDVIGGALLGAAILWAVLEIGKLIWGDEKYAPETPAALDIDAAGLHVSEIEAFWEDILIRDRDRFIATVGDVEVRTVEGVEHRFGENETSELIVNHAEIQIGEWRLPLTDLQKLSGQALKWRIPREVMGLGDVKLLAMIGAFLGAEAILPVLMLSALSGSAVGIARYVAFRRHHQPFLPYGPFLAVAAVLWFFAGPEMVVWYREFLLLFQGA